MKRLLRTFFAMLAFQSAWAAGFGVSPPVVFYELSAGEVVRGTLQIKLNAPATLKLQPVDWRANADGEAVVLPYGSLPQSLGPYLLLLSKEQQIYRSSQIPYEIALPKDARGCYYAGLLLQQSGETVAASGLRVRPTLSLLVPFFVNVKEGLHPSLRLEDAEYKDGQLIAWLRNDGNACLHAKVEAVFLNEKGEVLEKTEVFRDYLVPEDVRRLSFEPSWPESAVILQLRVVSDQAPLLAWEVSR